jgi:hypothetical protein
VLRKNKAQQTRHPVARLELTLVTGKVFQYTLPPEIEAGPLSAELLEASGLFREKWLRVDDRTLINTECVERVVLVTDVAPLAGIFPG